MVVKIDSRIVEKIYLSKLEELRPLRSQGSLTTWFNSEHNFYNTAIFGVASDLAGRARKGDTIKIVYPGFDGLSYDFFTELEEHINEYGIDLIY